MKTKQTYLRVLHQDTNLGRTAATGVSLHCHTRNSMELMDFIPHYAEKIPVISYLWKKEQERYLQREGKKLDFSNSYWTPPLDEQTVYQSEQENINKMGLEAIVSITDHDCINGNLEIGKTIKNAFAPISLEWTVPFEFGFFHLGIHNLPPDKAKEISEDLLDFTFAEERNLQFPENHLTELFSTLNHFPEVLIVLNHPVWDIAMVGEQKHALLLEKFVRKYGEWIHAFEINGFRTWSENQKVIELAEELGFPLVSGGDRHGCQANTIINLTDSKTFAEFTEEIRLDKHSQVVLLPEYKQPLMSRQLQSFSEILSYFPEMTAERQRWIDRIYYDVRDGNGLQKLSFHWKKGGPDWLKFVIKVLSFLGDEKLRPLFRLMMNSNDVVPKSNNDSVFVIPDSADSLGQIYLKKSPSTGL